MAIDITIRVDPKKGTAEVQAFGRSANATFNRLEKRSTASVKRMGGTIQSVMKRAAATIAGVFAFQRIVRGFKDGLEAATDFQKGIAEIRTLGIEKSFETISKEVDALTREFGQRPQDTIKAYYDAISAGIKEANIGGFMREASRLAIAGATDISTATDLLTTLSNVFRDETTESLAAFANEAKNLGKTTIPELAGAIGTVAATARVAGASVQELFAATVSLTKQGINTELAMTGLRALFSNIITPAEKVKKVAKDIGIEFSVTNLRTKGLAQFLSELLPKLQGNSELITQLFGNVRAFNAVAAITNKNAKDFTEALEGISGPEALENLQAGFEEMANTAAFSFALLREEVASVGREIGDRILPELAKMARSSRAFISGNRAEITRALTNVGQFISKVGSVFEIFVEAVVGGLFFVISSMAKANSGILKAFSLAFQAVLGALRSFVIAAADILNQIPGINIDVKPIVNALDNFRKGAGQAIKPVTDFLDDLGDTASFVAEAQFAGLRDSVDNLFTPFAGIVREAADATKDLAAAQEDLLPTVDPVSSSIDNQKNALERLLAGLKKTREEAALFAEGFFNTSDAIEQAAIAEKLLGQAGKISDAFGGFEDIPVRIREVIAAGFAGLAEDEQLQLLPKLLSEFDPEVISPELSEKIIELFGAMDMEELRANLPSLITLLTSDDPEAEAQELVDKLKPTFLAAAGSTLALAKGVGASFKALSAAAGPAQSSSKKLAKISLLANKALAVGDAALLFAQAVKEASNLNFPIAALKLTAAGLHLTAATVSATQAGSLQTGGLVRTPSLTAFAETGPEIALPLEDERTTSALAEAFAKAIPEAVGGEGGIVLQQTFQGFVGSEEDVARAVSQTMSDLNEDADVESVE